MVKALDTGECEWVPVRLVYALPSDLLAASHPLAERAHLHGLGPPVGQREWSAASTTAFFDLIAGRRVEVQELSGDSFRGVGVCLTTDEGALVNDFLLHTRKASMRE